MESMRKRVYIMLLMTLTTVIAAAQTAQDLLSEANAKYEAGQMEAALELYTQAANKGLATGMSKTGFFLHLGKGCLQDYAEAFIWFKKAAENGNIGSMYNLGVCYENGKGIDRDYAKAAYWYEQAARYNYENSAALAAQCRLKAQNT